MGHFICFVIPLEFQESINRFMAQPTAKKPCGALMRVLGCEPALFLQREKEAPILRFSPFRWFPKMSFELALFIVYGCFISTSAVKNRAFFQFSPRRDLRLRHFSGYLFVTTREKVSTIFITQPLNFIGAVIVCGCFISTAGENTVFFPSFPLGGSHG